MPFENIDDYGFWISYFLAPFLLFALFCYSVYGFLNTQEDEEKREFQSYVAVVIPLFIVTILSFRALFLFYGSSIEVFQLELIIAVPLVLFNTFYLLYCPPVMKFWIFYGLSLFYLSLYLFVWNWLSIDNTFYVTTFVLLYCQVFLVGEIYRYLICLVIELVTRRSKLCDDPTVFWLINFSKWFLFYGYLGVVVAGLATLVFIEGPVLESPINLFLMTLFVPFFPDMDLFTGGIGSSDGSTNFLSSKAVSCDIEDPKPIHTTTVESSQTVDQYTQPPKGFEPTCVKVCVSYPKIFGFASDYARETDQRTDKVLWSLGSTILDAKYRGGLECESHDLSGQVYKSKEPCSDPSVVSKVYVPNGTAHASIDKSIDQASGMFGSGPKPIVKRWIGHRFVDTICGRNYTGGILITTRELSVTRSVNSTYS